MFQSSSPSYLLLCSLDAAADVARGGPAEWEHALRAAKHVRHAWRASGGRLLCDAMVTTADSAEQCMLSSGLRADPLRVTLLATAHGMSGYECADRLEMHGVAAEMATDACVVLALGIGSTLRDSVLAAEAFQKILPESSPSKMLDNDYNPSDDAGTPSSHTTTTDVWCTDGDSNLNRSRALSSDSNASHATGMNERSKRGTVSKEKERMALNRGAHNHRQPSRVHNGVDSTSSKPFKYFFESLTKHYEEFISSSSVNGSGVVDASVAGIEPAVSKQVDEVIGARVKLVRGVREAATGQVVQVGWQEALEKGAVCGGLVCVYPPGVPVLVYGERVDEAAVAILQQSVACGAKLVGCRSDLSDIPVVLQ